MSELSIVIPCFNEKSNIQEIAKQIGLINTKNTDLKIEFILVNNGSTDGTLEKLLLLQKDHNFKIIDLKKNKGYGGGILAGVNKANSNIIAWTHGDLQCDLNDIIIPYKKRIVSIPSLKTETKANTKIP